MENRSQLSTRNSQPLTDSPWFWGLLFAGVGLAALVAISGKYGRRQAVLERKYQARQRLQADMVAPGSVKKPDSAKLVKTGRRANFSTPEETLIPLWPVAGLLLLLMTISGVMLWVKRE